MRFTDIAAGVIAAFVAGNFWNRWSGWLGREVVLPELDLTPGPWFCYYMGDYLTDHPDQKTVHSAPVELADDTFIWATNTPVWDREWFESQGWAFPEKWVAYDNLADIELEMKRI